MATPPERVYNSISMIPASTKPVHEYKDGNTGHRAGHVTLSSHTLGHKERKQHD